MSYKIFAILCGLLFATYVNTLGGILYASTYGLYWYELIFVGVIFFSVVGMNAFVSVFKLDTEFARTIKGLMAVVSAVAIGLAILRVILLFYVAQYFNTNQNIITVGEISPTILILLLLYALSYIVSFRE